MSRSSYQTVIPNADKLEPSTPCALTSCRNSVPCKLRNPSEIRTCYEMQNIYNYRGFDRVGQYTAPIRTSYGCTFVPGPNDYTPRNENYATMYNAYMKCSPPYKKVWSLDNSNKIY